VKRFEILTLFPGMLEGALAESILGKGREAGHLDFRLRDVRDHAEGRHRVCDDSPYGGGAGMVMKPEPVVAAIEAARAEADAGARVRVVLLTPSARVFRQADARALAAEVDHLVLVCGRYEGIDERVRAYVDDALSLGDFVLSGGEPAALAIVDAVARLVPGVLGNEASAASESFEDGLLEYPQYTRPPAFRGEKVPPVLLSGDHARIARWRRDQALVRTRRWRPDLLASAELDDEDRARLAEDDGEAPGT
jgi:tRNA (guanine37-N1)-methyltransferase